MRNILVTSFVLVTSALLMAAFGSDDPLGGTVPASLRPVMVPISAPGTFTAGSPVSERHRFPSGGEGVIVLTLTYGFRVSETEITREQYRALMKRDPSVFAECDTCPQDYVTWYEATAYCDALSALEGRQQCYAGGINPLTCTGYRLLTDAEFEWLSRSGDPNGGFYPDAGVSDAASTALPEGSGTCIQDTHYGPEVYDCDNTDTATTGRPGYCAPYAGGGCKTTMPAKSLPADLNGLYGIRGNIIEWLHDCWCQNRTEQVDPVGDESEGCTCTNIRAKRGCSHYENLPYCRHAWRSTRDPSQAVSNVGFRVVLNGTGS